MYPDGGGLYLQVSGSGTKSWIFRFSLNGREREMGLGPLADVTLADARDLASKCRNQKRAGIDPIEARKAERRKLQLEAAKAITFRQAADAYIAANAVAWRNSKHGDQWRNTLKTYVYPVFGETPVQQIDVGLVTRVLDPIWATKNETASRVRGRIETILAWASSRGFREGENPARWRGHLENLLPQRSKVRAVTHHAALPFAEIAPFVEKLRRQQGTAARALEFLILTAARTGEVIGARWNEMNLSDQIWSVPADRMKGNKAHRVPLSGAAISILVTLQPGQPDAFVFRGAKKNMPLSNMAMLVLLKRMGRADLTAHGFRSSFRDWVSETTTHAPELAEMALAHAVENKVEAAYRRGDMFDKRRALMDDWSNYCRLPASSPSPSETIKLAA